MTYIGQSQNQNQHYFGSGTKIIAAMKLFGRKNFIKEIIEDDITTNDELNEREKFWIDFYQSYNPEKGYNISRGENKIIRKHSEEEKQKESKSMQGKIFKNTSSKYVGVYWDSSVKAWRSKIKYKQKNYDLGIYDIEENAALAYNHAAIDMYGEEANLNILNIDNFIPGEIRIKGKRVHCSSNFVGVDWDNSRKKWRSQIYYKHNTYFIGRFDREEDAARAYNEKALEMYGRNARINIIKED